MSDVQPRNYGWADEIVSPAHEFDTLLALDQEEWISASLATIENLTDVNFADEYRKAREAYRAYRRDHAIDEERVASLLDQARLFGYQASVRARQVSSQRVVVSFSARDRLGIVAEASQALAAASGNVEGAYMSVVAEQLLMTFLLSAPAPRTAEECAREFSQALAKIGYENAAIVPLEAEDSDWPRPGSSFWHLTARQVGTSDLIIPMTETIAECGIPVLALSSWEEQPLSADGDIAKVVDLNLAIAPHPRADPVQAILELKAKINDRLRHAQISYSPVALPTRFQPIGRVIEADEDSLVLTLLGHAEPGLVCATLKSVSNLMGPTHDLRGSTMAVLEGVTAFTMVLAPRPGHDGTEVIAGDIETRIVTDLRSQNFAPRVARLHRSSGDRRPEAGDRATASGSPTHELAIQVAEQPWVLARVSRVLASTNVNINWLVSYVLEPLIGEPVPRCAMEMQIAIPPDRVNEVERELRSLAATPGWNRVVLRDWMVRSDDGA